PKDEEYYRDRPKHDGILARSELHPARQKMTSLCAQHAFGLALRYGTPGSMATSMPAAPRRPCSLWRFRSEQLALCGDIISDLSFGVDSRERRQTMRLRSRIEDVIDRHSPGEYARRYR